MSPDRHPLLLIHGIGDTERVFDTMVAYLRDRGWSEIHTINLVPSNGDLGLEALALQVKAYINLHLRAADQLDIVGFSMGGIVGRYYLQRLGGLQKVRHFVTLSSPHNGTWAGYLRLNAGARQMRPGSFLLQDLNQSLDELKQVNFVSVWTPYDLIIVPASSSYLPVGTMVQLPVLAHPLMLTDERSLETVAWALAGQPIASKSA
jgi:triacylglycerol lipase